MADLRHDKNANIGIAAGLSLIPLMGAFGMGIDSAMAASGRAGSQKSLDAAVMAGARTSMQQDGQDGAAGAEIAQKIFNQNNKIASCSTITSEWENDERIFTGSSNCVYNTRILSMLGMNQMSWTISSAAQYELTDHVELVFLIDMSYRMCGEFGQQYNVGDFPACKYILDELTIVSDQPWQFSGLGMNCMPDIDCSILFPGTIVWWDADQGAIAWSDLTVPSGVRTALHIIPDFVPDAASEPVSMEILNKIGTIDETGTKAEAAKQEINLFMDEIDELINKYRFGSFKIGLIAAQKGINVGTELYSTATGDTPPVVDGEEVTYILPQYDHSTPHGKYDYIKYSYLLGRLEVDYPAAPSSVYYQGDGTKHYGNDINKITPLTNVKTTDGVNKIKDDVNDMRVIQLTNSGARPTAADMIVGLLWARNLLSHGWSGVFSGIFGSEAAPKRRASNVKKLIVIISEGYTEDIYPNTFRRQKDLVVYLCEHIEDDKSSDGYGYDLYAIGYQVYDYTASLPYGKELNSCAGGKVVNNQIQKSPRLYNVAPNDTSIGRISDIMDSILFRQGKLILIS